MLFPNERVRDDPVEAFEELFDKTLVSQDLAKMKIMAALRDWHDG
jgi:hypothetical protein